MDTTKILRWAFALIATIIIQFVVSTIIYNLQHIFNIFNVVIIFTRHFLSVFISINIGLLIVPTSSTAKFKVFKIFYSLIVIGIMINLFISKAESTRIASATIECFGIVAGLIAITSLRDKKR